MTSRLRKSDLTITELQRLDIEMRQRGRSRDTFWALWGLLSYFGAHRFYIGDNLYGGAMFLTSFVPMVGIVAQFFKSPPKDVVSGWLFWFFIFWLSASLIWSWIDALLVNPRFKRFQQDVEDEILREIAADRAG